MSGAGDIVVPLLSATSSRSRSDADAAFRADRKSAAGCEAIAGSLVNVFVEEHNSHSATVLGAVAKPGVYPLIKPTRLLELLSMAGGLNTSAGATLTISHARRRRSRPRKEDSNRSPNTPSIIQIGQANRQQRSCPRPDDPFRRRGQCVPGPACLCSRRSYKTRRLCSSGSTVGHHGSAGDCVG